MMEGKELLFPWLDDGDFENEKTLYLGISRRTAYFNKVLKMICEKVGIQKISSHSLRHTFCTTLISKGVPITSISNMVGNSKLETTMIYSQILDETVDEVISVLET